MRDPHTEETIIDKTQEALFGETNITRMKHPTTTNTIEPMMAVGMIIRGMRYTLIKAKITGEKMDTSTNEDLMDRLTTCNLKIPDI